MKSSEEVKRWVARARQARGKKNGVVSWLWDNPKMERKCATDKRVASPDAQAAVLEQVDTFAGRTTRGYSFGDLPDVCECRKPSDNDQGVCMNCGLKIDWNSKA